MRIIRISSITLAIAIALAVGIFIGSLRSASIAAQDEPIRVKGGSLIVECPDNKDCLGGSGSVKRDNRGKDKWTREVTGGRISQIRVLDSNNNDVFNRTDLGATPTVEIYYK